MSSIDFEVEKRKLASDMGIQDPVYKRAFADYEVIPPGKNPTLLFQDVDENYRRQMILKNWNDFTAHDVFSCIATIQTLASDYSKKQITEEYVKYDKSEKKGMAPVILSFVARSLDLEVNKEDYIEEIERIVMDPSFLETEYFKGKNKEPYYTAKECQSVLKDRLVANVAATLGTPYKMTEYCKKLEDPYARKTILDAIEERFPEYKEGLTTDGLAAVLRAMQGAVDEQRRKNDGMREKIEQKIAMAMQEYREARQEYENLKRADRQHEE